MERRNQGQEDGRRVEREGHDWKRRRTAGVGVAKTAIERLEIGPPVFRPSVRRYQFGHTLPAQASFTQPADARSGRPALLLIPDHV
jgi:hypothetical protein